MSNEQNDITRVFDELIEDAITDDHDGHNETIIPKFCIFNCPICGTKYRCKTFESDLISSSGMINTIVKFPCGHSFDLALDRNGKIRASTEIRDIQIIVEKLDVEFLRKQERKLLETHAIFVANKQEGEAFKIHEQIKAVRREIILLELNNDNV